MRHNFVMLLAVVALLGNVGTASVAAESQITTSDTSIVTRSLTADQNEILTKRFLRSHKPVNDDEERGVSTPSVENVVKSTSTNHQLEAWLKKGTSADAVFKALTLQKAANSLLGNPNLNTWISFMKLFNKQNPSKKTSLIATLTAHYGDLGLTKVIEAA